ncbi:MAG: hypothetical protein QOJ42_1524 [Acidobacteriaceae bacterium]|nr:hypothetical protein [Acidobacteriaceae bacterium]
MNEALIFSRDGAQLFQSAINATIIKAIKGAVSHLDPNRAGVRFHGVDALKPLLDESGPIGQVAAFALGERCRPVRALLFDKTPEMNWSVGWHQDRTIVVTNRIAVDGFGPWSIKSGLLHVVPPFELLAQMVTLRVHLDAVSAANSPLLIARQSHRCGRVPVTEVSAVVRRCDVHACLAAPGDIWLYATPILHASEAATAPRHRRVLQIDYSADSLPGGLEWLGL